MGRRPCCDKVGLKKGPWTIEEDKKLINFIFNNGQCCWRAVPKLAGLLRCGKSCRLRWINYLRPDLRRGILSEVEEKLVIQLHSQLGNRWSKIASYLPGRTDNEIKNHWNTHIKKKLKKMGIDALTHKPLSPPVNDDNQDVHKLHEQPLKQQLSTHCSEKMDAKDGETEFCIDEVPLIQPHEMLNLISPISSTSSNSPPSSSFTTCLSLDDNQLQSFDWESFWGDDDDFSMDILIDKKFNL